MSNVEDYLQQQNVAWKSYSHSPACTAVARAEALERKHRIDRRDVAKVLFLRCDHLIGKTKWIMAVLPAEQRLDLSTASQSVGEKCRLATEEEIEHKFIWCSLGCFPALGGLFGVPEYIDPDLCKRDRIFFSAGQPTVSLEVGLDLLIQKEPRIEVDTLCVARD
ncbi:YbaK/EbsC family protein [Streptomyces sp. NPDC055966]|uniref:YbaK/EbsC family protein n=1 Tax=Streptomyces sp. NPDC055966 TaxID=3345669 RepID=UPI0035DC9071